MGSQWDSVFAGHGLLDWLELALAYWFVWHLLFHVTRTALKGQKRAEISAREFTLLRLRKLLKKP